MGVSHAVRHETYYFPDGNVVLQLDEPHPGVLYRLHASLLQRRSTFFEHFLPDPNSQSSEGYADETPIHLPPYATQKEWDFIFCFLLDGVGRFEASVEAIIAVLKMSRYLDVADGIAYAVTTISQRSDFNSFLKLHLAISYNVDIWVKDSFLDLLKLPICTFTISEVNLIGNFCLLEIAQTQQRIAEWRLRLSYEVPSVSNHPACPHPCQCLHAWDNAWWNGLARHILHPEKPLSTRDIIKELDNVKIPGMCDECQEVAVAGVKDEGALMLGNGYIKEAAERVWNWYSDRAARAMMIEVPSC